MSAVAAKPAQRRRRGLPWIVALLFILQLGDGVKTDGRGRGTIQLPDGTLTRLASNTELTLTSAHFAKDGNLKDASITQKIGRTFTNFQHLASGATYKVSA